MSNRCNTHSFAKIRSNWDGLNENEKAKHLNVHHYFCALHFLVALADATEAYLKVWEETVLQDPKEIGALSHESYSNGEAGCLRFIRTISKLVQERGCGNPGRMITLLTFRKESHNIIN